MIVLSEEQVKFILNDIRRNGIEREELQLDLLDHICCVLESEMNNASEFEVYYRSILPRFFKQNLREIQEETNLLLTFKHYYTMKKILIYSGGITVFTFIIGAICKLMHWPGAAFLLISSIVLFSFIFLPLLFLLKVKEVRPVREKLTISIATVFAILISCATMFKLMHWPGATLLWSISLAILFFLFLPIYFFGGIRNPETKVNVIISSVLIIIAGGLLFTLINIHGSKNNESSIMLSDQALTETAEQMESFSGWKEKDSVSKKVLVFNQTSNALCAMISTHKNDLMRSDLGDNVYERSMDLRNQLLKIKASLALWNQLKLEGNDKMKPSVLLNTTSIKFYDANKSYNWEETYFLIPDFRTKVRNLNLLMLQIRIAEQQVN